jgi:cytochrome c peroxidase
MNKGLCYECHFGPEFTSASIRVRGNFPRVPEPGGEVEVAEPIENMFGIDGRLTLYDGGFYNIGARPTHEDLGVGGQDPFGNTLSFARQAAIDSGFPELRRLAVDGAFKTPTIRNVELTGPYMHNGGHSTLKQVVEFYDRGGDRRDLELDPDCFGITDTSGFGITFQESKCTNIPPAIAIGSLNLLEEEIDAVVAFMLALTDNRVKNEMAPFDHPELLVANGHLGHQLSVVPVTVTPEGDSTGLKLVRAKDTFLVLPAVGAGGRPAEQRSPLETFLRLNPFSLEPRLSVMPQLSPLLLQD